MDGYLLDTNVASILWDARHRDHHRVKTFLENIPNAPVWISIIVLAEIEYGLKIAPQLHVDRQNDIRNEMTKFFLVLNLDKHTVALYSDLRAKLFKKYSPASRRGTLTVKRPENLVDRTTAKELGVQENDIWIAAQAIQYNLILVTQDTMSRIAEVSTTLPCPLQIAVWK